MSSAVAAGDLMGTPNEPKASMEQKAAAQPQASHAADVADDVDDIFFSYSNIRSQSSVCLLLSMSTLFKKNIAVVLGGRVYIPRR